MIKVNEIIIVCDYKLIYFVRELLFNLLLALIMLLFDIYNSLL